MAKVRGQDTGQKGRRVFRGYSPGSSLVGTGLRWWGRGRANCDRAVPQVLQRTRLPFLVRAKTNQPVECPPTSHAPLLQVSQSLGALLKLVPSPEITNTKPMSRLKFKTCTSLL